jgi:hypothetical protein
VASPTLPHGSPREPSGGRIRACHSLRAVSLQEQRWTHHWFRAASGWILTGLVRPPQHRAAW